MATDIGNMYYPEVDPGLTEDEWLTGGTPAPAPTQSNTASSPGLGSILSQITGPTGAGFINMAADIVNDLVRQGRMNEARSYIESLPIPSVDKMTYQATLMKDPDSVPGLLQQDTRLSEITEDPRLRDAQMETLGQLQQRGREGYTIEDKAAIQRSMDEALTRQKGANLAQEAQMARRGISGSGIDIAGKLARQQAGIQAASQSGLDIAARGRQQALQAMQSAGQLGGQIRGQEWGQKAQEATAQDRINAANIANRMTREQLNMQALNRQKQQDVQAEKDKYKMEADKAKTMANTYMG